MTEYHVFYNLVRLEEPIEADDPLSATSQEVMNTLFPLLKDEGEYLGLTDSRGTTLQMIVTGDEQYWVEVPNPEVNGSFGTRMDWDEVRELLRSLPAFFPTMGFDGFEFVEWSGHCDA